MPTVPLKDALWEPSTELLHDFVGNRWYHTKVNAPKPSGLTQAIDKGFGGDARTAGDVEDPQLGALRENHTQLIALQQPETREPELLQELAALWEMAHRRLAQLRTTGDIQCPEPPEGTKGAT